MRGYKPPLRSNAYGRESAASFDNYLRCQLEEDDCDVIERAESESIEVEKFNKIVELKLALRMADVMNKWADEEVKNEA